jgi:hypothetical protein
MNRIAIPDLAVEEQVKACGIGLIALLGSDLYHFINTSLNERNGKNWLEQLLAKMIGINSLNLNDASTLFKTILRPDYPLLRDKLREAINFKIEKVQRQDFYNRLASILEDRNQWVHNNVKGTPVNLLELVLDIEFIGKRLDLELVDECRLIRLSMQEMPAMTEQNQAFSQPISQVVDEIKELAITEEKAIGAEIEDGFLDHSYTLQLSGEIRDRKTDQLLSQVIGNRAEAVGTLFLARKPSGGRLKITASGEIAAYFDGKWGYLARVSGQDWFTGHLG